MHDSTIAPAETAAAIQQIETLDDIRRILAALPGPDETAAAAAAAREPQLTKPEGALGRLEEISAWLCRWQGRHPPRMEKPQACVFAGNHGVAALGVSAFPPSVTEQMVANFEAGGAAINQLCRSVGASLSVHALELDRPTRDFTTAPAMDDEECAQAIALGIAAVNEDSDVVCPGEMGIGNTTAASAICHALFGRTAGEWTGPGTGVVSDALRLKADVVARGVACHAGEITDGLDTLRRLGGRELAAIAGLVIGARIKRVPVLLDGFICTAAAATLAKTTQGALDHCMMAHVSAEPAHRHLAAELGKRPLFDLGLRLGEGTGAVLAVPILKGAVACHTGMATFADAGVSEKAG
ncbi:MAG: nicotinate-nucleotide--dimethylbenzimidazole phosphoribosyltransferase [Rhodospirillales bacterium]|nr:nicotinate-nucleotide--dimethylbenzimidazole phosphoribosyltransferase [Rhodospirillales bacterium]